MGEHDAAVRMAATLVRPAAGVVIPTRWCRAPAAGRPSSGWV